MEEFETVTMPEKHTFGSFNLIMVKFIGNTFANFRDSKKRVRFRIESSTLPTARGYWNIHGREFKIFYKKELIAILHTEDCGLGSAKAYAFLQDNGFRTT